MGIKLIRNRERFVFETYPERNTLEKARNYFGEISAIVIEGWDYKHHSKKYCGGFFYNIKRGSQSDGRIASISLENWERTVEYALRYDKGERYDPEIFIRPDFQP